MADQSANSAHVSHDDLRVMMDAINKKTCPREEPDLVTGTQVSR